MIFKPRLFTRTTMAKKLVLGFLILLFLGLGSLVATAVWISSNLTEFQAYITEKTGLTPTATSFDFNLNQFPYLYVEAENIKVYAALDNPPILTLDHLSVAGDLHQLLLGNVILEQLQIKNPKVQMNLSEDGQIRLGDWVPETGGGANLITVFVNQLELTGGNLELIFPEDYAIAPVRLTDLHSEIVWQANQKNLEIRTQMEWEDQVGTITGKFLNKEESWEGSFSLSDITIHPFAIPKVEDVFPTMPLEGLVRLGGTASFRNLEDWQAQLEFGIEEGSINNPRFPGGKMILRDTLGQASLVGKDQMINHIAVDVTQTMTPFGKLKGLIEFHFAPDKAPIMTVDAKAAHEIEFNQAKPYIYGFAPVSANEWIEAHIFDGIVHNLRADLNWEIRWDYQDESEVLELNLLLDPEGMTIDPVEGLPPLTNAKGSVKLGLWGVSAEVESADYPGGKVREAQFRLPYGVPEVTPLEITGTGRVETQHTWPAVRPFILDDVPWLDQLNFQGEADVQFHLEDPDLADDEPVSMTLTVLPDKAQATWKADNHEYRFQDMEGKVIVTLDEVSLQEVPFTLAGLQGKLSGEVPYAQIDPSFQLEIKRLETLLPRYTQAGHPMQQWWPETLSAEAQIYPKAQPYDPDAWQVDVVATDSGQQQIQAKVVVSGDEWKIDQITGRIGQISLQGSFDVFSETSTGKIQIQEPSRQKSSLGSSSQVAPQQMSSGTSSSEPQTPATSWNASFHWNKQQASVAVKTPGLVWQDWLFWQLPEVWNVLLPPSQDGFPVQIWELDFHTSRFFLSPNFSVPFGFEGTLVANNRYHLDLSKVQWGTMNGNLIYDGTLQKGSLDIHWDTFDVAQWVIQLQELSTQSTSATQSTTAHPPTANPAQANSAQANAGLFQEVDVNLNVDQFRIPGNAPQPLQAKFNSKNYDPDFDLRVTQLRYGNQQAIGRAVRKKRMLDIRVESQRLDLLPWLNMIRRLNTEIPSRSGPDPLDVVTFDIQADRLYFTEALSFPFSTKFALHFGAPSPDQTSSSDQTSSESDLKLLVSRFETPDHAGQGSLVWQGNDPTIKLRLGKLDQPALLRDLWKVDWQDWINSSVQGEDDSPFPVITYDLNAPEARLNDTTKLPFHLEGIVTEQEGDLLAVVDTFEWGEQRGEVQLSYPRGQWQVHGDFEYLNVGQWDEWLERARDPQHSANTKEVRSEERFTVRFPETAWEMKIRAKKGRFVKYKFEELEFQGSLTQSVVKVPKFVWRKKGKPVFSLAGYINLEQKPGNSDRWKGKMSLDIAELGELIDVVFDKDSQLKKQYPVERGQTQIQAGVELFPTGNGRWRPHAKVDFKSREGIIKKGSSLVFLLATLSIQSYVKAVSGKLSGFEGRGLVYNKMDAHLTMRGKTIGLEDFVFASPNIRIVASGNINYEKDEQDLLICLQPFETLDNILGSLPILNQLLTSSRGAFLEACYRSTGHLDNPNVVPLPQTLLPGRLRDLLIFEPEKVE